MKHFHSTEWGVTFSQSLHLLSSLLENLGPNGLKDGKSIYKSFAETVWIQVVFLFPGSCNVCVAKLLLVFLLM